MGNKVWLVTGCSRGLGKTIVSVLLKHQYRVIATSRDKSTLIKQFGSENDFFLPLSLDLTNEDEIKEAIMSGVKKFETIDVLVNNAGYLQAGTVEEIKDSDVRKCFDINVFGSLNMIRSVLPVMRKQQSGHIINTSSMAGTRTVLLGAIYSATKAAINSISYTMAEELRPFGIHVTNIEPGAFRTEFLNSHSYQLCTSADSPYNEVLEAVKGSFQGRHGNQPGDPEQAAELYLRLAEMNEPPVNLTIGSDAYQIIKNVLQSKLENLEKYKEVTFSTDFKIPLTSDTASDFTTK